MAPKAKSSSGKKDKPGVAPKACLLYCFFNVLCLNTLACKCLQALTDQVPKAPSLLLNYIYY